MAERTCLTCAKSLDARSPKAIYCSPHCGDVGRGHVRAEPFPMRTCRLPECGIEFQPFVDRQFCCCEKHGRLFNNRRYRASGREVRAGWDDNRKNQYHRRRAILKGAKTGRPVLLTDIADRDQWICGICESPVYASLTFPHPLSPSLDHVVPLTLGGAHDPDNVQLAHIRCNIVKGNRVAA